MKRIVHSVIPALMGSAGTAFAATESGQTGGMSWLMIFFLAFFGLIVAMQVIPGVILFVSMIRGIFSPASKKSGQEADNSY